MSDTQNDGREDKPENLSVNAEQKKGKNGQGGSWNRNFPQAAVKILQGPSALKISDPPEFIHPHQHQFPVSFHDRQARSTVISLIHHPFSRWGIRAGPWSGHNCFKPIIHQEKRFVKNKFTSVENRCIINSYKCSI